MKNLADFTQIMLDMPGILGYISCLVLVVLSVQILRSAGAVLSILYITMRWVKSQLIRPSAKNLLLLSVVSIPVFLLRQQLSDGVQWFEQAYINPVYLQSDTSTHALAIYETELSRHVDPYEMQIVKQRTREIAAKVGSTPLAIYEVAYSECGLNPFCIRKDGIAAGWIQFTTSGLTGLGATLSQVKDACCRRDTKMIMDLTEAYLVDRSKGKPMPRSVDIYTCVFAPGHLGRPDNFPLYQGFNRPEYYLNIGLDGYYLKGTQIFRSRKMCDGQITIADLNLALQYKKAQLLQSSTYHSL